DDEQNQQDYNSNHYKQNDIRQSDLHRLLLEKGVLKNILAGLTAFFLNNDCSYKDNYSNNQQYPLPYC
ncbi:MAG: hypothetical protein ACYTE8_08855, partial [Planctomycetota bacterium]